MLTEQLLNSHLVTILIIRCGQHLTSYICSTTLWGEPCYPNVYCYIATSYPNGTKNQLCSICFSAEYIQSLFYFSHGSYITYRMLPGLRVTCKLIKRSNGFKLFISFAQIKPTTNFDLPTGTQLYKGCQGAIQLINHDQTCVSSCFFSQAAEVLLDLQNKIRQKLINPEGNSLLKNKNIT